MMLAVIPLLLLAPKAGEPVDVAPFGIPLPEGGGIYWEDPREVHKVVVRFAEEPPEDLRLEYWGSRWPEQRLPEDREVGAGDSGWWELGNWYGYGWRKADTEAQRDGPTVTFTFRPVNASEFPKLEDYPARFRFTLKLRLVSESSLPKLEAFQAYSDSVWERRAVRLAFQREPAEPPKLEAFNGVVEAVEPVSPSVFRADLWVAANPDVNTFDRTLVTVPGEEPFTFAVDDLKEGPLLVPHAGVAVLPDSDERGYEAVAEAVRERGGKTLYDRVAEHDEHTWKASWGGMPPKKSLIYLPLGLDGGRQRFMLHANGTVEYGHNEHFLRARPGRETPRLEAEGGVFRFGFGLPDWPKRTLVEGSLPLCEAEWEVDGVRVRQTAFVTMLEGSRADGPTPDGDATAVLLARFTLTNSGTSERTARLPLTCDRSGPDAPLTVDDEGRLLLGERLRGWVVAEGRPETREKGLGWSWKLAPGETRAAVVKLPYVWLERGDEERKLAALDFERELREVTGYWRRRLDHGAELITPEPMLNEFYRAHAGHLLINCEREPNSTRRFARVGSFGYGAYGNESCMMVADLDRRGYHVEARECLDAWLHYQGTVGLPGDFSTKEGVLYGAGGYEAGGYNQHHGWILWCLAEHYRFTRDREWLKQAAPGILKGAQWIIGERARTADRKDGARGLLPAGSLEDIGDWWPWLSTNCYTWRGLDSAAWALEQIGHPEAARLRKEADDYHAALLRAFREASRKAPVVRLRDGTALPKFPSHVYRRGRSFGWICETLEGSLHLLITRAIDPKSREAEWIVKDYEDNLYLSSRFGYTLDDFEAHWFDRGGISMQSCLLLDVEPYLYRDDVKHALRALFNGIAVGYFPDVRMITEHALPEMGDWRGDHYKSSDEANAAGWLRQIFVREEGDELWLGQAVPRDWLKPGSRCGIQGTATYFGPMSVVYEAREGEITARVEGPTRNAPRALRLRFRHPSGKPPTEVTVDGKPWTDVSGDWVLLPGNLGAGTITARW